MEYMQKKIQTAIIAVEKWSHKWGFKISVTKSQVICFAKKHKKIVLKLNDQELEQVRVIRFLGVLLDEKLTWKQQIDKIKLKCKTINNVLRCLSGLDWGATRSSLRRIYWALMRSTFDYGCSLYVSIRNKLKKLDIEQAQALRICIGAFKSSPVAALQVEIGEMPLSIRRLKLMLAYWVIIQGHSELHPTKAIVQECWEHNKLNFSSFGWIGHAKARKACLHILYNIVQQFHTLKFLLGSL